MTLDGFANVVSDDGSVSWWQFTHARIGSAGSFARHGAALEKIEVRTIWLCVQGPELGISGNELRGLSGSVRGRIVLHDAENVAFGIA